MVYEVNDNRLKIEPWFFEMDTQNNINVYAKGLEYYAIIKVGYSLDYEEFKYRCKQWIVEENK